MNIEISHESDAVYIKLSDKTIAISKEVTPDVIVDLDADGNVVGIDLQHVSELHLPCDPPPAPRPVTHGIGTIVSVRKRPDLVIEGYEGEL